MMNMLKRQLPDQCGTYDIVQYVEENFGVKLLEYQKEFLRQIQSGKQIYIIPARRVEFTVMNKLMEIYNEKY